MSITTLKTSAADAGTLRLGGRQVHRMGFGAMRLTGDGIWGPPADHDEALRVLRTAVHDLGVNFVDTADAYGPEVSENLIAEALHPYPGDLVVATKGGLERSGPGKWERNGRPAHLRSACEASLRRLRVERIEIYQLHAPDPDVPLEESLGELVSLRHEGKIHHIGVSNFDVSQLDRAMEMTPIVSVQNRYNVIDRGSDPVLSWCEEHDVAFLPWRPIAGGQLDGLSVMSLAARYRVSPVQIALAWLLRRSPMIVPIPGTSNVEHLQENIEAAALDLTEGEVEELSVEP